MTRASDVPTGKYRVLVIEDDPQVARLIRINLVRVGLECRYAADGVAGVEAFRENKPNLILLDLMLPRLSGQEVCAKIRESSTVPIIIMTAADSEEAQLQCFRCGADDYVTKPFDPRLLAARVIAHLRRVYRYDIEEDTKSGFMLPTGWLRCDGCRYKGPEDEFEDVNNMGLAILACPKCGKRAQAASSPSMG